MSTKNVTIASTVSGIKTITTNATTFGELKSVLIENDINPATMVLVNSANNVEYSLDSAVLPETDFQLLAFPKKTKSGVDLDRMEDDLYDTRENIGEILDRMEDLQQEVRELKLLLLSKGSTTLNTAVDNTKVESTLNDEQQELLRKALLTQREFNL